ncbi:hypothetical protein [Streptomyces sp. NPDC057382]|uniref:hypothetical protein n=1 Tax=unclassified Streptomyces TaxID=2593676 RepID=UPI00363ECF27
MHLRTPRTSLAATVAALALTLTACGGGGESADGTSRPGKGKSESAKAGATFRLGESSPIQESTAQKYKGSTYTLTPTKVETGTKADMAASGLKKDKDDEPQVPVYVWTTLKHVSGKPMESGDMDDDLIVRTDKGKRTRALIVLLGEAKWPDCPAPQDKTLSPGQSQKICKAFLIPAGQKASAVELFQGFYKKPLEWPVNG